MSILNAARYLVPITLGSVLLAACGDDAPAENGAQTQSAYGSSGSSGYGGGYCLADEPTSAEGAGVFAATAMAVGETATAFEELPLIPWLGVAYEIIKPDLKDETVEREAYFDACSQIVDAAQAGSRRGYLNVHTVANVNGFLGYGDVTVTVKAYTGDSDVGTSTHLWTSEAHADWKTGVDLGGAPVAHQYGRLQFNEDGGEKTSFTAELEQNRDSGFSFGDDGGGFVEDTQARKITYTSDGATCHPAGNILFNESAWGKNGLFSYHDSTFQLGGKAKLHAVWKAVQCKDVPKELPSGLSCTDPNYDFLDHLTYAAADDPAASDLVAHRLYDRQGDVGTNTQTREFVRAGGENNSASSTAPAGTFSSSNAWASTPSGTLTHKLKSWDWKWTGDESTDPCSGNEQSLTDDHGGASSSYLHHYCASNTDGTFSSGHVCGDTETKLGHGLMRVSSAVTNAEMKVGGIRDKMNQLFDTLHYTYVSAGGITQPVSYWWR